MNSNLIFENVSESVFVARFLRPDVREAMYDHEAIGETSLFKELREGGISQLPPGGTLILNFGLIDWFPTAFYRVLIQTLHEVRARGGRLILCCLTANVKEGFEMMSGHKLLEVHNTEARAIASAAKT
jgi:anti-anti-sigma factor